MRIVFRTEGNHAQGMGDVWGCLALADEFRAVGDEVLFVVAAAGEAVAMIGGRQYPVEVTPSCAAEAAALGRFNADAIVVNKLNNEAAYIRWIRDTTSACVVTIDDAGEGAGHADLRINVLYDVADSVRDPKYIALRREFQEFHRLPRTIGAEVRTIAVTQGGSDTYGFTPPIVRALGRIRGDVRCVVVAGPAFRHDAELADALGEGPHDVTVVRNASNMSEILWTADLVITAGGLTAFEAACVGTPPVIVCAERFEVETARRLEQAGAAVCLGFGGDLDYRRLTAAVDDLAADQARREEMSRQGRQLVDGAGAARVAALIHERAQLVAASGR